MSKSRISTTVVIIGIFLIIFNIIGAICTPAFKLISFSLGILFASISSILVIANKRKQDGDKKNRRIIKVGLIISLVLSIVQFVYILSFFIVNINNYKQKSDDEIFNETITVNDTLFYECDSYIYSYSEFLHCINVYKDGEYVKTYYINAYVAEGSEAYIAEGIFYVSLYLEARDQMIYAYKDGEYYGRLSFFDDSVDVYDKNDCCVIEHKDVQYDIRQANTNKYVFFTYDKVYYNVLSNHTYEVLDSFVVNNGNIEATSFSVATNDKVKIKNSCAIFTESQTTLKVKTNILTYFYPFNKLIQVIVLVYSILQALYLLCMGNKNKNKTNY